MSVDPEFRERQRKLWASGDWPEVAKTIQPVADALVERLGVGEGDDVLDIGTGSGNVAIPAAQRGATVVGSDITPELFEAARARAEEAGVEVDWVEADAAELPFEDASFDTVLSVFGAMFAPVHQAAADEVVRVTRPGGEFGLCAWRPEGTFGRALAVLGSKMPPPPEGASPPILWGAEDHVRGLFEGKPVELTFENEVATWDAESADDWLAFAEENLGPVVTAKRLLEPKGEWEAARAELDEIFAEWQKPEGFGVTADYLRVIGRVS
jgi:SAM-dependent methyltransferase